MSKLQKANLFIFLKDCAILLAVVILAAVPAVIGHGWGSFIVEAFGVFHGLQGAIPAFIALFPLVVVIIVTLIDFFKKLALLKKSDEEIRNAMRHKYLNTVSTIFMTIFMIPCIVFFALLSDDCFVLTIILVGLLFIAQFVFHFMGRPEYVKIRKEIRKEILEAQAKKQ